MSDEYRIAETDQFSKKLESKKFNHIRKKLYEYVYPILKREPIFSPNTKKLKGELENIFRYRLGNFRLFYSIEEETKTLIFLDISERKDSYR
ncbi:MAG: type II toxin-antitoxin system RelE/ParE family toxin [Leptospira sp.]|nr:type II toxin-antitoxin system RelE/ParE family toxin [Leptospira sp.]